MKPSIFSKDYNRYIRRKRTIKFITLMIALALVVILFAFGFFKTYFDKILNTPVEPIAKQPAQQGTVPEKKAEVTENKFREVKISDSLTIKVGIDVTGTDVKYNGMLSEGLNGSYDISKAASQMVFLDKTDQTVYLIDKDGKSTDVTYKKYVSKNKKVYEKAEVLKDKPDFIWADSPKFLGETKILYVSNIPWFGTKRRQYLWIYDIKEKTYKYIAKGDSVILNGVKDKGFEVKIDDKTVYIDNDGRIVK